MAAATNATAQSFTDHLQEKRPGGTITIKQDASITQLVDNADLTKPKASTTTREANTTARETNNKPSDTNTPKKDNKEKATNTAHNGSQTSEEPSTTEPTTESTRRHTAKTYKTNGYRIQIYSGGNSKNDKLKAQQVGSNAKRAMPDQAVYVHFLSPRWTCRMGNYRTYEEASAKLREVKELGFNEAFIVNDKVTVAY